MVPKGRPFHVVLLVLLALLLAASGGDSGTEGGDDTAATTAAEEGSGELKRFDGTTIRVVTLAAGPKGVISGVAYKYGKEWSKLTGGKVEVAEVPYGDIHTKVMADLNTGIGNYDGLLAQAWFYGDYMAGDHIVPIDDYLQQDGFPEFENDAVLPSIANLMKWGDKQYAPPFDGDQLLLWYRKDVLADEQNAADFKAKYGYDLPNPPTTVDQLIDTSEFFQGKDWSGDGKPDIGMAMSLKSGQSFAQFPYQAIAAPYAILPGDTIDQYRNTFWFDPETLEPLINQPGHVRGLEKFVELVERGTSKDQLSWDLGQSWEAFLQGRAVFTINTADIGSGAATSPIKGKLGGAAIPGSDEVYNRESGEWEKLDEPNIVGNLLGANWNGVISKLSDNPEAVYSFFAFLATKENMIQHGFAGWDGVDPTSTFQFLPPGGDATEEGFVAAGWDAADAKAYSDALIANLDTAETFIPYLRTRGTSEFLNALDSAVTNVLSGRAEPQAALDDVAEQWKRTVDELGEDEFKEEYQTSINSGKAPEGP